MKLPTHSPEGTACMLRLLAAKLDLDLCNKPKNERNWNVVSDQLKTEMKNQLRDILAVIATCELRGQSAK